MSISDERLAEMIDLLSVSGARMPARTAEHELVDAITELQSLRAAAKVRAIREGGEEWQTMENAPLDGKHCILAVEEGPFVYSVQGAYDGKQWNCVHRGNVDPLYWMPNKRLPKDWLDYAKSRHATQEGK